MPVPSRKELVARLESLLGSVLQAYSLEGKKNRKLTEKTAGQLAKAFRKNARKREAKKTAIPATQAVLPKQPQQTNLASPL